MEERRRLLSRQSSRNNVHNNSHVSQHEVLPFWKMQIACGLILFTVILERIAYYGLTGNLVLFLNAKPFSWMSYNALNAMFYFLGLSYISPLFGGWLADSFLGRYRAIIVAFVIYIAGYTMMPLLSPPPPNINLPDMCPVSTNTTVNTSTFTHLVQDKSDNNPNSFEEHCAGLIYLTLTIVAIGAGSVKANLAPIGADQVLGGGQQLTLVFFNWFYWCINIGAFIGLGVITYIEQQYYFFSGYVAAGGCLALAACLFLFGGCFFIKKPASGSVLTNIFRIINEACRSKRRNKKLKSDHERYIVDEADNTEESLNFLDYAKHRHGGIFHDSIVDDVRELKKIIFVFLALIPYWIVFFQMQTTFLLQGLHMKLFFQHDNLTANSSNTEQPKVIQPQIVAAWISLFDAVILILMLPLFDRVIYPKLAKAGYQFTMTKRIIVGMIFAMASMCVAGVVENYRLKTFWPYEDEPCKNHSISQPIGGSEYYAADMSIFWQIPQYALIGISEVFTSISGLHFAVSMAPKSMKGIIMGLFYFTSGMGSFIGTGIISVLNDKGWWFVDGNDHGDINCRMPCSESKPWYTSSSSCHLDYYFYFLAGVEFLGLVIFIIVSKVFGLDQDQHNQVDVSLPTGGDNHFKKHSLSVQRLSSDT